MVQVLVYGIILLYRCNTTSSLFPVHSLQPAPRNATKRTWDTRKCKKGIVSLGATGIRIPNQQQPKPPIDPRKYDTPRVLYLPTNLTTPQQIKASERPLFVTTVCFPASTIPTSHTDMTPPTIHRELLGLRKDDFWNQRLPSQKLVSLRLGRCGEVCCC